LYKKDRCGIVNVTGLTATKTVDGIKGGLKEVFERRVEKESLRGIAIMLGMPECPSLRCALFDAKNDKLLDFKSRNPCPPCLEKIRNKLRAGGLELRKEKLHNFPGKQK
jgi:predicted Zn-dependent protease